jgi:transcriptional regulator with XRE-family HTH domain
MKTIGQRIRELREEQDLSLREFARRLGNLSAAFISDVELGRRFPSEKILEKMSHILGVSADELRSYDTRPPIEELRRIVASDPTYGFALRRVVEGKVTAEDLMKLVNRKKKEK